MPRKCNTGPVAQAAVGATDNGVTHSSSAELENELIAKALYIASRTLVKERGASYSEADRMKDILRTRFASESRMFDLADDLKIALNLGFLPTSSIDAESLHEFINDREVQLGPYMNDYESD